MIPVWFQIVIKFGEKAVYFLGVPGRPVPALGILEIITQRSSDFCGTMSGLPH